MSTGWFITSADLKILEWSEDLSRGLRIPNESALGRCCREVLPACSGRKACPALDVRGCSPEGPCLGIPLPTGQILVGYADGPSRDPGLTLDLAATLRLASWLALEELDRGLERALETLNHALEADAGELFLASPLDGEMVLAAHAGWRRAAFCERTRFLPGEGFPGLVAAQGKVLATCEVADDPRFLRSAVKRHGIHSYICAPLLAEGRVLGSLNLAWRSRQAPLDRAARLLNWAALFLTRALQASYDRTRLGVARTMALAPGNMAPIMDRLRELSRADTIVLVDRDRAVAGCPALGGRVVVQEAHRPGGAPPCRGCISPAACAACLPLDLGSGRAALQCLYTRAPLPITRYLVPSLELLEEVKRSCAAVGPLAEPAGATGAPAWSIRCFGPLEIRHEGRLVARESFVRQKALTLLRVLLLQAGRPIGREALCELLWPDADLQVGSNRLHGVLHALRQVLEKAPPWQHVCLHGDGYCFRNGPSIQVDLFEFERNHNDGRRALQSGDHARAAECFEKACDCYQGELFEDEPYAEWCWSDREQCRERYLYMLKTVAELSLKQGDLEKSEGFFRRALQVGSLREDLHQGLMVCLWRQGRRTEALRQYDECARLVRQELDADPLPDTQRLVEALRKALPVPADTVGSNQQGFSAPFRV